MISHTFLSIEDWHASAIQGGASPQWPFVVKHGVEYGGAEWVRMCAWLEDHVGEFKQCWAWIVSDHIRFKTESDACLFAATWT